MSARIGAVIVHHGDPRPTLDALRSVQASRGVDLWIVVVDHGPGPPGGLREAVEAAGAGFLRPPANGGFAAGLNRGIEAHRERGPRDLYFLLNHDVTLEPDAALVLSGRFEEEPALGVLGPAILHAGRPGVVWNAGSEIEWPAARPRSLLEGSTAASLPGTPQDTGFVCGCAALVRAEVLERTGPVAERYFLYFEDADLSFRARAAGFRVMVEPRARAHHTPGSAASARPAMKEYLQARNRILFSRRWAPPGLRPPLSTGLFAVRRLLRGGAAARGALDGLRGRDGPPPEDLLLPASR